MKKRRNAEEMVGLLYPSNENEPAPPALEEMSEMGESGGANRWFANRGRQGPGGGHACPDGPSCDRPPGGSLDHQPQHFLPLEFEVFREDRERGNVEGAPVILGLSGFAPILSEEPHSRGRWSCLSCRGSTV